MSQHSEVIKSGYLTKSPPEAAALVSQWRRRWFVLLDSSRAYPLADRSLRMEYYQNESDTKKLADPKGLNAVIAICIKLPLVLRERILSLVCIKIITNFWLGVVNLKGCSKIVNREPVKGHKFVFDVHTNNRVFHLAADTAVEKHEWVQTLNNLLFTKPESKLHQPALPQVSWSRKLTSHRVWFMLWSLHR